MIQLAEGKTIQLEEKLYAKQKAKCFTVSDVLVCKAVCSREPKNTLREKCVWNDNALSNTEKEETLKYYDKKLLDEKCRGERKGLPHEISTQ